MSTLLSVELNNIEKRMLKSKSSISTGILSLDKSLGNIGFEDGHLYVLASRPSMGKSSLALNFLINAQQSLKPDDVAVFISTNDSTTVLIQRLLSIGLNIPIQKIQYGEITESEAILIKSDPYLERLCNNNLVLIESETNSFNKINKLLINLASQRKKVRFLIIDKIQSFSTEKTKSREEGLKILMKQLKDLSIKNKIPILITSDVNRRVEISQSDKYPRIKDMAESKFIGYMSDFCMVLVRPEYYDISSDTIGNNQTIANIKLQKNIYGPLENIVLHTKMEQLQFMNMSTFRQYS